MLAVHVAPVQHGGHHRVLGRQLGRSTEPEQQLAGVGMAAGESGGVRRTPGHAVAAADPRVRVDAVFEQQLHAGVHAVRDRPPELDGELVGVVEAELEQQDQVAVVGTEGPVVEGLGVVGVGAGLEQRPGGQRFPLRVAGLVVGSALALALLKRRKSSR